MTSLPLQLLPGLMSLMMSSMLVDGGGRSDLMERDGGVEAVAAVGFSMSAGVFDLEGGLAESVRSMMVDLVSVGMEGSGDVRILKYESRYTKTMYY